MRVLKYACVCAKYRDVLSAHVDVIRFPVYLVNPKKTLEPIRNEEKNAFNSVLSRKEL